MVAKATLPQVIQLKQKVVQLKPDDYTRNNTFNEEELTLLDEVAEDSESPLEDRIYAARALYNIAENRRIRAERSCVKFKARFQALEHERAMNQENNRQAAEIMSKFGPGVEDALKMLLDIAKAKKEMEG